MTKQNFLINPLKYETKKEFMMFLKRCDRSYINLEIKHIEKLIDEYFLLYLEYKARVVAEIIIPLTNKYNKDKENCNKNELKEIVDKTIKLGFELKTILEQKAKEKVEITNSINNGEILEDNVLLIKASRRYNLLKNEFHEFSKSSFNCVDQLLRRLINVPAMYYQNLFGITNTGDKTIDDYLLKKENQIIPDVLVGKCEDMKTHESGECWANSYSIYSSTFLETIKLINQAYYAPEVDNCALRAKWYAQLIRDLRSEDYISASKIQKKYSISNKVAESRINVLINLGLVSKTQERPGHKVNKKKLEKLFYGHC